MRRLEHGQEVSVVTGKHGFSILELEQGVLVRKSAAPCIQTVFLLPILIPGFVLALVGTAVVAAIPYHIVTDPTDGGVPLWGNLALGVMFAACAVLAWWAVLGFAVIAARVDRTVELTAEGAICRSALWRLRYMKRTLPRPVVVVVEVYGGRGDVCFRVPLVGASGRHFWLTIPTSAGSSRQARKNALSIAIPVGKKLNADVIVKARPGKKWLPTEKVDERRGEYRSQPDGARL